MTSLRRPLAVVALVGMFMAMWTAHSERDVGVAQSRKPMTMTRIYTGADGLSHAEDVEMTLTGNGTAEMKATRVQFSRRRPGPASAWHVGPRRQFVITLSGRAELEVAGGRKVAIGPGHINLIEDTTGKAHITQNIGPDDRTSDDPARRSDGEPATVRDLSDEPLRPSEEPLASLRRQTSGGPAGAAALRRGSTVERRARP